MAGNWAITICNISRDTAKLLHSCHLSSYIPNLVLLGSLRIFSKQPGIEGMASLIFLNLDLWRLATLIQNTHVSTVYISR